MHIADFVNGNTFNPCNYTLNKDGSVIQNSRARRIWNNIINFFNRDAKWIKLADSIKACYTQQLEHEHIINEESLIRHTSYKKITELAANKLSKSKQEPAKQALRELQRHQAALATRVRYAAKGSEALDITGKEQLDTLKTSIVERLKDVKAHFWCIDFHGGLDKECQWFEKRWNAVSEKLANTPELVALLQQDPTLLEEFINWSFRDNCPVEIFAAFPTLTNILKPLHAGGRLGRASEHAEEPVIRVNHGSGFCHVELKIEDKTGKNSDYQILQPGTHFEYGDGFKMTPEELGKALVDRYDDIIPNFQFTQNGMIPFHVYKLVKTSVDHPAQVPESDTIDVEAWWNALPDYEVISLEEAQKRCAKLTGENAGLVIHGTTDSPNMEVIGNHGYDEVLLPNPNKEGTYKAYPIGRVSKETPRTTKEQLAFLGKTVEATVMTPEQSEEYSIRQNWGVGLAFNKEATPYLKEMIVDYVKKGNDGKLPFSLFAKNCHAFAHHVAKKMLTHTLEGPARTEMIERLDKLMIINLQDTKLMDKLSMAIFNVALKFARGGKNNRAVGSRLLMALRLFGAGRVFKRTKGDTSVLASNRLKNAQVYMPSKIRPLAQEAIKNHALKYHVVRNHVYIPDGYEFLNTFDMTDKDYYKKPDAAVRA